MKNKPSFYTKNREKQDEMDEKTDKLCIIT